MKKPVFNHRQFSELRRAQKVLAGVLAEKVKCSRQHLSQVENGRTPPGPELVDRIAKALKVPPESLYLPPGMSPVSIMPTVDEAALLDAYQHLSESRKDLARAFVVNLTPKDADEVAAFQAAQGYQVAQDNQRAFAKSAKPKREKQVG